MRINFDAGAIVAHGTDKIGAFPFSGSYSESTGDCAWVKHYLGKHDVDYRGAYENGCIWGCWNIGTFQGGFKIWPQAANTNTIQAEATNAEVIPGPSHEIRTKPGVVIGAEPNPSVGRAEGQQRSFRRGFSMLHPLFDQSEQPWPEPVIWGPFSPREGRLGKQRTINCS